MPNPRARQEDVRRRAQYYQSRGYDFSRALEQIRKSFSGVRTADFLRHFEHYRAAATLARGFDRRADKTKYELNQVPSLTRRPSFLRFTVSYKFHNPLTGKSQRHIVSFDSIAGITKADIKTYIRDMIIEEKQRKYESRLRSRNAASRAITAIKVEGIEGI